MKDKASASLLLWVPVALFVLLAIRSAAGTEPMTTLFLRCSYYIVLSLFAAWVWKCCAFARTTGFSVTGFVRRQGWGLVLAFVMTAVIAVSIERGPRSVGADVDRALCRPGHGGRLQEQIDE